MVSAARLLLLVTCLAVTASSAIAQQRGSISGKVLDPDGLALPGATVVITNAGTGFTREATTRGDRRLLGAQPRTRHLRHRGRRWPGSAAPRAPAWCSRQARWSRSTSRSRWAASRRSSSSPAKSPLVERTSNQIGGSLSRREIEEVPSNFRNFTGLTQLIPGMTPNPATSTFEGGQVVANGSPSQQNVYLLDGMYNNDDRLGGSQGTQVRVVLDNIEEYQVLANQYSSEYGGGAGAIINMVTRGGTNQFNGRAYSYFRDETLNARDLFLPDSQPNLRPGRSRPGSASAARSSRTAPTSTSPTSATTRTSPARRTSLTRRRRWR